MPWKKGQSGNPAGSKAKTRQKSVRTYLIQKYGLEARKLVDELDRIAFAASASKDQLPALRELLTRHSGQPPQSVDVTSGGHTLPTITVIELPAAKG